MTDTPPTDDPADDLEALYRRNAARGPSRPRPQTRRAILEYASRVVSGRPSQTTGRRQHTWRRPVLIGSLAAAALAGLWIGPQYLRPTVAPVTVPVPPTGSVPDLRPSEPPLLSRPPAAETAAAPAAATSEVTPKVADLPAAVPAAPALPATPAAPVTSASPGADAVKLAAADQAAPSAGEQTSASGMRMQRAPAAAAATSAFAARNAGAHSPLMSAVLQGRLDTVTELLRQGADPNAADASGVTPLQAARARDESAIVDALLRAGAR
jgi:Ankyrin repeats (many copies)